MAVTDFETKVAVVVRDDLAVWQKLNVTAFLISGVIADAGEVSSGRITSTRTGLAICPCSCSPC